jgi:hypothetical protein
VDATWGQFATELLIRHGLLGLVLVLFMVIVALGKAEPLFCAIKVWMAQRKRPKRRKDDERPCKDIDITVRRINALIIQGLQALLVRYNACRCYVFEFEDYDHRIKPLPWLYATCTYEVCNHSRRVTCEQDNLQRIPLAAIKYWNLMLGTTGAICLHHIDEIKESDLESWKILAAQQIQSVYCVLLLDFRGTPLGFAGLDYNCDAESCISKIEEMEDLKYESIKIAGLLALKRNGTLEQLAGKL